MNIQQPDLIYADPQAGKHPAGKRRGLRRLAAALAAAGLMALVVGVLSVTLRGQGERYQKALTLLDREEYAAAAEALESLIGFQDSGELLRKLDIYTAALSLLDRADSRESLEKAARMFESLGDFADAQAKVSECRLAAAEFAQAQPD